MTSTPPESPPADTGPRVTSEQVRDWGRLRRSVTDRKVAGVAGGLARHLDIDPVILRVLFVVLTFFGGAGLLLYVAMWLLVPEDGRDRATIDLDVRNRTVALIGVAVLALVMTAGDAWGGWGFPWPLLLLALIALVYFTNRSSAPKVSLTKAPADPAGWVQPQWTPPPLPPPRPRKPGPFLFWFTLMLVVLGLGVLGMADVGGVAVADAAYPALALTIIGMMLLVGAFYGRGGGLILLGLLATLALALASAAEHWEGQVQTERPATAADVDPTYFLPTGELVLDLTAVRDLSDLDGERIEVGAGAGRIEVILPNGLDVTVDAEVGGPGNLIVFDRETGGINVREHRSVDGGPGDSPDLHIDASIGVGEIEVTQR